MNFLIEKLETKLESIDLFKLVAGEPFVFFLDSSLKTLPNGRYSFIGFDPFEVVSAEGKDALDILQTKMSPYMAPSQTQRFPFMGGAVGFLSYDHGLYQEGISSVSKKDLNIPDAVFGLYDRVIVADHWAGEIHIVSTGWPEKDEVLRSQRARARLDEMKQKIYRSLPALSSSAAPVQLTLKNSLTEEQYVERTNRILEHIACGDIYQINLSHRFEVDCGVPVSPVDIYGALRSLSPTSFSSYFDAGNFHILSSSPERFLSLRGKSVQTRPMKGTRRRGIDAYEDTKLRADILINEKERAELLMITDLERNDLGRVCEYGSVKVKDLRTIEEYKNIFQATSTIEGTLDAGRSCFDLIKACFPGGSITGCPKIRAMEIIDQLEPVRRSAYTGAFGYIDFSGDMDLNILIRTMIAFPQKIYFQVGSGIVADSIPKLEYEETLIKAQAMMESLKQLLAKPTAVSV